MARLRWGALAVVAAVLSGCGSSDRQQAPRTRSVVPRVATNLARPDAILSLSALGTFEGRCPRGAGSWTLRFVDTAQATDTFRYRLGTGARRTVNVQPGNAIGIHLVPDAARTHEPADRFAPPPGHGRGRALTVSVHTTARLHGVIFQATEPQTLRANVDLALAAIGGESRQCVLVGTSAHAYMYPNSGP
jgi:hypothetical protein